MNSPVLRSLGSRLEALVRHAKGDECSWYRDEVRMFSNLVLVQVGSILNIVDTCRRLTGLVFPKYQNLRNALKTTRLDFAADESVLLESGCLVKPHDLVDCIHASIDAIESARVDLRSQLPVRETFVFNIEAKLQLLLACYATRQLRPVALQNSVCASMVATGERGTLDVWRMICEELKGDREEDPWVTAATAFVRNRDFESLRRHIAHYMTRPNPERILYLAVNWGRQLPELLPGLAILISWKDSAIEEHPSIDEQMFAHSLARLDFVLSSYFNMPSDDIAVMLRVPSIRAAKMMRLPFEPDTAVGATEQLLFALADLLISAEQLAGKASSFLQSLRLYARALEARGPDLFRKLIARNEQSLKRDLAGHLIERNFWAAGTSFGSSCTDLLVTDEGVQHVVEVKVLKQKLSAGKLKCDLVQVYHYMSQQHPSALAVLLVYNFTSTTLVAADELIGGRCLILPVNINPTPPSRRKNAVLIRPGSADELIAVNTISGSGRPL
jgi:hypothetical protein